MILRPLCPPIPCANNTTLYARPYIPPHTQRIAWKPHTYKRAALLLIVLALHIDSRRNTPTLYTLSSVTYRPRIPTPHKESQRAMYTPQIPAPLQARRCTFFLCAFLLDILHTYHQRRNACTVYSGRIAASAHTIRRRLQPTPPTVQPHNASRCTWHISPTIQRRKASRNHCR